MKIGLTQAGALTANQQSVRGGIGGGSYSFGEVLSQQVASEKYRYDASTTGKTHSFSEMPIVAPAAVNSPKGSGPPGIEKLKAGPIAPDRQHVKNVSHSNRVLLERNGSVVDATFGIIVEDPAGLIRQRFVNSMSAPPAAVLFPQNQTTLRFSKANAVSASFAGVVNETARILPFQVRLSQATSGVRISIITNSLSDSEQLELESRASELARRYGLVVSELRVCNFGRRK